MMKKEVEKNKNLNLNPNRHLHLPHPHPLHQAVQNHQQSLVMKLSVVNLNKSQLK